MSQFSRIIASFFLYPWLPMLWGKEVTDRPRYHLGIPLKSNYSKLNTVYVIWGIMMIAIGILVFVGFTDDTGEMPTGMFFIILLAGLIPTFFYTKSVTEKIYNQKNKEVLKPQNMGRKDISIVINPHADSVFVENNQNTTVADSHQKQIEELKHLTMLLENRVITQKEFEVQKHKILNP